MSNPWYKDISRNAWVQSAVGNMLAGYLRLVDGTARKVQADLDYDRSQLEQHLPFIMTFWHGEHFMVAPAAPRPWNLHVMISRSADGSINAIAAKRFGIKPIRGSGDTKRRRADRGGASAFLRFMSILDEGGSVAQTADVPKVARVVSPGLIRLARKSGRPIVPSSYVTHPKLTLGSWDRASLSFPFTKAAIGTGAPIYIPAEDGVPDEDWCQTVHDKLTALERHGYAQIGGRSAFDEDQHTMRSTHG